MLAGPTDHLDAELREAEARIQEIYDKILEVKDVDEDEKEAKCWDLHDRLKPKHPRPKQIKINFRTGKTNPEALKRELENALVLDKRGYVSANAKEKVEMFVSLIDTEDKHMTDLESAMDVLKEVGAPQYMQHRLDELSKAEKVRWDTDDGRASKSDMTNFWEVPYGRRKQNEAEVLWRRLISDLTSRYPSTRALLPMMYWLKKMEGGPTWAEWNPYDPRSNPSSDPEIKPPPWALEYINTKTAQKKMNMEGNLFHPNAKPYKHPNAVYLLLCRLINGEGVPKEARVQAYAGMATDGVEKRWMEHAYATQGLMQRLSELKTFSATPLQSVTLVEVVVGRLYAEGGRDYITETNVDSHDNIALFVYRAYGKNAEGDNTNTKEMEKTEGDLIRDLELTEMKFGLNKIKPKENKAENAKNAEAGDKAKTKLKGKSPPHLSRHRKQTRAKYI
ncbi:hypothetical protein Bbelb_280720 [Branchiostoma belcheri]|nr:hypothetical protein Bbelb_280720 [Branchiostoma belcheri]